ncbi:uncharacterized protein LOC144638261 isoform X1 [Oculina patagonica]
MELETVYAGLCRRLTTAWRALAGLLLLIETATGGIIKIKSEILFAAVPLRCRASVDIATNEFLMCLSYTLDLHRMNIILGINSGKSAGAFIPRDTLHSPGLHRDVKKWQKSTKEIIVLELLTTYTKKINQITVGDLYWRFLSDLYCCLS